MEEYLVETEEYRGHKIKIYQDPDPQNPRDNDNFGTMVCFHSHYMLGDSNHGLRNEDFFSWDGLKGCLIREKDAAVILPLYLYDHSGITINTTPFGCRWDSGEVGFIYATRQNIRDNYGIKRIWKGTLETAEKLLEAEVKEYDRYLTGQVYGYMIEDADGEDVDSCWGYNGEPAEIIKECKATIDNIIKSEDVEASKHYPKVEVFVTKGMRFRASIRESIVEPTYEVTIGGESWGAGKGSEHAKVIEQKANSILGALLKQMSYFDGKRTEHLIDSIPLEGDIEQDAYLAGIMKRSEGK